MHGPNRKTAPVRNVTVVAMCRPVHARAVVERIRDGMPDARVTVACIGVDNDLSDIADRTVGLDAVTGIGRQDEMCLVVSNLSEWMNPLRLTVTLARCLLARPRRFRIILYGWSGPKSFSEAWRDIVSRAACESVRPVYLACVRLVCLLTSPFLKPRSSGKVLALSLDLIGDMVWASRAVSSLKSAEGVLEVHLLVAGRNKGLARLTPGVDRVITYDAPWLRKVHDPRGGGPGVSARLRNLTTRISLLSEGYAATVDFRGETKHAALMYFTGATERVGYGDRNATCIRPRDLEYMLTKKVDASGAPHMVEKHSLLVRVLGADPESGRGIEPSSSDVERMRSMVGSSVGPVVTIQPGASRPEKRWSLSGFTEVARRLSSERGVRIVIAGGPDEADICAEAAAGIPGSANLCGKTTLGEFVALVSVSDLVICNETSAISISSTVGTPVVCMMTGVPEMYGPKGVPHRVLQNKPPCYDPLPEHCMCPYSYRCLQEITPDEVYGAACELLDGDG